MSELAIQVRRLSKRYRKGTREKYSTLRDALVRGAAKPLRTARSWWAGHTGAPDDSFWALRDVELDVNQGDVLGIIGRNGAGKSTLLRVLAGITDPTEGYADIYGRVGCLLEVGTGFHMELSGRENIFMNGALLGLSRHDIKRRFDEIVAFAETEAFIDTPVKHYSSGMYMRLAFAVAAHLDPEILIVDEVLAVGDVQFQRKCLGRMQDISRREGRTVLFVSHNMTAIQRLCARCVLLDSGRVAGSGSTGDVIATYLSRSSSETSPNVWLDVSKSARVGTGEARFTAARYSGLDARCGFHPYPDGPLEFGLTITSDAPRTIESLAVTVHDLSGTRLVNIDTVLIERVIRLRAGSNIIRLRIDQLHLNPGRYTVALWLANPRGARSLAGVYDYLESAFDLVVVHRDPTATPLNPNAAVACQFRLLDIAYGPVAEDPQLIVT
jgi:homopolymeric O-antigen transport system ATP-binding protein